MGVYAGRFPVYVSHVKEVEQLLNFTTNLIYRQEQRGHNTGKEYKCLVRVRQKCADLLLRMYAEDDIIMLMDTRDRWWIQNIVEFVHEEILKNRKKAG